MKTIVQLLVAALIINASFQAARAAWKYYAFTDEIQQQALHGKEATATQLHQRVLEIAEEHGVPLEWGDIEVQFEGDRTSVDVTYLEDIPLVPGIYTHTWTFQPSVSIRRVRPVTFDDLR